MIEEGLLEKAIEAAIDADIIPLEGGRGVRIDDYLEFSVGDALELGVILTEKDKDGKPRWHWYSDIRGDEYRDMYRALIGPMIRAALQAYLPEPPASANMPA